MSSVPPQSPAAADFRTERRRRWCADLLAGTHAAIEAAFLRDAMIKPDIDWAPEPASCLAEPNRVLLQRWQAAQANGRVAGLDRIEHVVQAPEAGFVHLVEPSPCGEIFVYRVFGAAVGDISGGDFSGRDMTELKASDYVIDFGIASCAAVRKRGLPLLTRRRPARAAQVAFWERLLLPFADDSNEIARLVIGIVPLSASGGIVPLGDG